MKHWIGRWLISVAVIHTVFAIAVSGRVLASIAQRGVFNTVGADPLIGEVVWLVLFGVLLFACGLAVSALERASSGVLPKSIGWSLLVLTALGVVLMPTSGFWLVFPPAVAVLARKPKAKFAAAVT
jgi:hypothetical protein